MYESERNFFFHSLVHTLNRFAARELKCMFKHIVFEFAHEEREGVVGVAKSMEIEFGVLPTCRFFFFLSTFLLLFIYTYTQFFFVAPHRFEHDFG